MIAQTEAILATVLSSGINQPLRPTTRKTTIRVYNPYIDGLGHIYEMGIPIQSIDMPFDVDIGGKVPLPPNRDVVSKNYLQDVYAEVLAVTTDFVDASNADSVKAAKLGNTNITVGSLRWDLDVRLCQSSPFKAAPETSDTSDPFDF